VQVFTLHGKLQIYFFESLPIVIFGLSPGGLSLFWQTNGFGLPDLATIFIFKAQAPKYIKHFLQGKPVTLAQM
jgi:hypothetical protein